MLYSQGEKFRKYPKVTTETFLEVGGEKNASLISVQNRVPNLRLNLSFVSVRRKARKTPWSDRLNMYRKEMPQLDGPKVKRPEYLSRSRKFIREDLAKRRRAGK